LILTVAGFVSVPDLLAYKIGKTDSGAEIKWFTSSTSVVVNTSGGPSGSLSAIQNSLQTWNNVSTSNFLFSYAGETTSTVYGSYNSENIIMFGYLGEDGTVGLNTTFFYPSTGQIIENDIKLNTVYTWSTDGSGGTFDVQNITTHELGHSLNLGDLYNESLDSEKTMYGYGSTGETKKRTLHQDDKDGITYLYPGPTACVSHDSTGCYAGNVYWYDSCGDREEKKETCSCSSSIEEDPYCQNGDIYEDSCDHGCSSGECYSNSGSQKTEECGETEYTTDLYCCGDDICKDKIVKGCEETTSATCYENDEVAEVIRTCGKGCLDGKCQACVIDTVWPESFNTMFWFFGSFCLNELFPSIVPIYISSSSEYFDNTEDIWIEHNGTTVLWQNPIGDDTVMAMLLVTSACYSASFDVYVGDCLGEDMFILNEWMQ